MEHMVSVQFVANLIASSLATNRTLFVLVLANTDSNGTDTVRARLEVCVCVGGGGGGAGPLSILMRKGAYFHGRLSVRVFHHWIQIYLSHDVPVALIWD